jgi:hypothetical protein
MSSVKRPSFQQHLPVKGSRYQPGAELPILLSAKEPEKAGLEERRRVYKYLHDECGISAGVFGDGARSVLILDASTPAASTASSTSTTAPAPLASVFAFFLTARQVDNFSTKIGCDLFHFNFANVRMVDAEVNTRYCYDFESWNAFAFPYSASFSNEKFTHGFLL